MGVVGHQRAAAGAMPRHGEAVAARPGEPAEPALHRGGPVSAVDAGRRRRLPPRQAGPELGPVGPRAQREQVGPDQPGHVGAGQAPDGEHVGDRPGLGPEAENGEIVRQLGRAVLVAVESVHEAADPEQGGLVHGPLDLRRGAGEGEGAEAAVDIDARGADHLGNAPPRDHPRRRHLSQPQVRVHEAERERRVAVAVGLDEGNLPVAPMDRHPPLHRQAPRGEGPEAPGDVLPPRPPRQQRARREGERGGGGGGGGSGGGA